MSLWRRLTPARVPRCLCRSIHVSSIHSAARGRPVAPVRPQAHQYELGSLVIGHPGRAPRPAGVPMGVAYLSITNHGTDARRADSAPARRPPSGVEFHQTTHLGGHGAHAPAERDRDRARRHGEDRAGRHPPDAGRISKAPLEAGKSVPLTLEFRNAGNITVELSIEARDAPPAAENAMTQSLGMVTVVARRPSSLPTQIPTTIEGISGETVARTVNATDSEDALKYFPSLTVRKRYIGDFDHAVLASRASGTQNSARSLVYADGILLSNLLGNGATFTPRWGTGDAGGNRARRRALRSVLRGLSGQFGGRGGRLRHAHARIARDARRAVHLHRGFRRLRHPRHLSAAGRPAPRTATRAADSAWWLNFNRLDSDSHPIAYANTPAVRGRRARQRRHPGHRRAAGAQSAQPGLVVVRRDQHHRHRAGSRQAQVRAGIRRHAGARRIPSACGTTTPSASPTPGCATRPARRCMRAR